MPPGGGTQPYTNPLSAIRRGISFSVEGYPARVSGFNNFKGALLNDHKRTYRRQITGVLLLVSSPRERIFLAS